jgi:hypothetical protein
MRQPPSRPTMWAGLTLLALLMTALPAPALTADGTDTSLIDATPSEADAIRFRSTFGFESSLAFVRSAAADGSRYSNVDYGVPLDAAEVAELNRRAAIQEAIDPMVEKASTNDTFAGVYLDQKAGGAPVFMFTAGISDRAKELSEFVPAEFGFRTESAARTYRELTEVNDQIASSWERLRAEGIDIVRAGIRTDQNIVEVGVTGLTTKTSNRLTTEFGPGIVVVENRVAQADACVSVSNCRPMKGGIKITRPTGYCTSGFVVKTSNTGEIMMLTAGHCLHVHGGLGAVWSHNSDTFGIAAEDTWHPGVTRNGDVGLIDIYTSEVPATKNQLLDASTTVKSVGGWDSAQLVGDQTCRAGATWGVDCGQIRLVNVTRASTVSGVGTMTVQHTNEVSFDSTGGDSGGSMYFRSGAIVVAQGTHVHSDVDTANPAYGWFTPISWGKSTFSGIWGYDYSVCVSSSCS